MIIDPNNFLVHNFRPPTRVLDSVCCDEGHALLVIEAYASGVTLPPGVPAKLLCYCAKCDNYRHLLADNLGENV